jgi:hypothetical protein
MPCALSSDANYPNYVKSILKEIDAGNDESLKACACSLKGVFNEEGCPILMNDNKIAVFPFCIEDTEVDPTSISFILGNPWPVYPYGIGLSLDDMMYLFWNIIGYKAESSSIVRVLPDQYGPGAQYNLASCGNPISQNPETLDVKKRICSPQIYFSFNRNANSDDILYNNASPGCTILNHEDVQFFGTSNSNTYPVCYRYNNLYYPRINYSYDLGAGNNISQWQRAGGPAGNLTLKINNTNYNVPVWYPLSSMPTADTLIYHNLKLISPILYRN